jgi:hypothetical protein
MSYVIDGKIANQTPDVKLSGIVRCGKCCKNVPAPDMVRIVGSETDQVFICASYIGKSPYIYETRVGIAVVYCSKYCRDKHNHRFSK